MWSLQPVDYDSLPNPFFNLTVYAQDPDPTHVDTAYVEIRVTDYNDNAPLFVPNSKKVSTYYYYHHHQHYHSHILAPLLNYYYCLLYTSPSPRDS